MSSRFKRHTEIQEFPQGSDVLFNITFYSDRFKTVEVDPATVVLVVHEPDGVQVTVVNNADGARPANLGKYEATYETSKYGLHNFEWRTTNPKIVEPGKFNVIERETNV